MKGYLITAAIALAVLVVVFRVPKVRSVLLGM